MPQSRYHIAPLYSSAAPGEVDEATALRVAAAERAGFERMLRVAVDTPDDARAALAHGRGLAGIVESRQTTPSGWRVFDVLTGETFDRAQTLRAAAPAAADGSPRWVEIRLGDRVRWSIADDAVRPDSTPESAWLGWRLFRHRAGVVVDIRAASVTLDNLEGSARVELTLDQLARISISIDPIDALRERVVAANT